MTIIKEPLTTMSRETRHRWSVSLEVILLSLVLMTKGQPWILSKSPQPSLSLIDSMTLMDLDSLRINISSPLSTLTLDSVNLSCILVV